MRRLRPELREENKKNKEGWKNDRMVRGYAFAIPNRVAA
jgi:hypothetical protein